MKYALVFFWAVVIAGAAGAFDMAAPSPALPTEYELRWDNGTLRAVFTRSTGFDSWFGNDFSVATLGARRVARLRFCTIPHYGFRAALFAFTSTPGSIIWPTSGTPAYVPVTAGGSRWCDFSVNWNLPAATNTFLVGWEQYYDPPANDPFGFDSNPTSMGHTWLKYPGEPWQTWTYGSYVNLMLRVVMNNEQDIHPASLGRVKALYE